MKIFVIKSDGIGVKSPKRFKTLADRHQFIKELELLRKKGMGFEPVRRVKPGADLTPKSISKDELFALHEQMFCAPENGAYNWRVL